MPTKRSAGSNSPFTETLRKILFGTTIAMVKFDAQMATVCLFPSSGGAAVQSRRAPAPRFQLPQSCILMPDLLEASLAIASIGYPLIFRLCTKRRETACVFHFLRGQVSTFPTSAAELSRSGARLFLRRYTISCSYLGTAVFAPELHVPTVFHG